MNPAQYLSFPTENKNRRIYEITSPRKAKTPKNPRKLPPTNESKVFCLKAMFKNAFMTYVVPPPDRMALTWRYVW